MDLALNNLQRLICHKTQQTNQQTNQTINTMYIQFLAFLLIAYWIPFGIKFDYRR